MGRNDRRPALSQRAIYPEGSDAGDAMDVVLDFYGVDRGVVKDPAYSEPWDDADAQERCFNESCVAPVLGREWTTPSGKFDERKLLEKKPKRNDKFFIADLRCARHCGYKPNVHAYRVNNPDHSVIKAVSMRLTALCRHQAPSLHVPMSTGGWIALEFAIEQLNFPGHFLVEVMRSKKKARFQLLASCDADQDPNDAGTMCSVEAYP